jgi:Rrf2 family protein
MKITVAVDYGIRALQYLARQKPGKVCLISEISREQDIPVKFLAKIMQSLSKGNLVKSYRGVKGGFTLSRPPEEVTLRDAVECLEGPVSIIGCLSQPGKCVRSATCLVRPAWQDAQDQMLNALEKTDLKSISEDSTYKISGNS